MYKYRDDIPEKYDDAGPYMESVWRIIPDADTLPPKRLVIELSENEKGRIKKKFISFQDTRGLRKNLLDQR